MSRALNIMVECSSEEYAHRLAREFYNTLCQCGIRECSYNDIYKTVRFNNNDIFRFVRWDDKVIHKGFRGSVISEHDVEKLISVIPLMGEFYNDELFYTKEALSYDEV